MHINNDIQQLSFSYPWFSSATQHDVASPQHCTVLHCFVRFFFYPMFFQRPTYNPYFLTGQNTSVFSFLRTASVVKKGRRFYERTTWLCTHSLRKGDLSVRQEEWRFKMGCMSFITIAGQCKIVLGCMKQCFPAALDYCRGTAFGRPSKGLKHLSLITDTYDAQPAVFWMYVVVNILFIKSSRGEDGGPRLFGGSSELLPCQSSLDINFCLNARSFVNLIKKYHTSTSFFIIWF